MTAPQSPPSSGDSGGADRTVVVGGVALLLTVLAWTMLPVIGQSQGYHQFADQREWLRVPNAADVLSNVAFALVGLAGAIHLAARRRARFVPATEAGMWCIALGLVGTAAGSATYHLDPADASLVWDRVPMTLVFAGVLGAAMAQRVGDAAGRTCLALLVPAGFTSVAYWVATGNLSPYLTVQYGGIALLLLLLVMTRTRHDVFPWKWVIAWYVLAKVAEMADRTIWEATGGLIAGHTVKHLLAAAAGAAALWPLRRRPS